MNSFYTAEELKSLGLKHAGNDVLISKKCSIYSPEKISIGNNVRIDDFCILSGNIEIGSNIHIAPYCALYGALGIVICDYSGLSARSIIYSAIDDFSGDYLIGPIHPESKTNVRGGKVVLEKFTQIGVGCTIFPDVCIQEGTVVGAHSFVKTNLSPWGIYAGSPVKFIKERNKNLLNLLK